MHVGPRVIVYAHHLSRICRRFGERSAIIHHDDGWAHVCLFSRDPFGHFSVSGPSAIPEKKREKSVSVYWMTARYTLDNKEQFSFELSDQ